MKPYAKKLKPLARTLRTTMTDAEQRLWQSLRRKQICGVQFYRQKPLLEFIVDFYCPAARFVIELDGSQHEEPEQKQKDVERDAVLRELGLKVVRFDNRQVLTETEAVLTVIERIVREQLESVEG